MEIGETLAEAAERELWEETKVRGSAVKLLGMFDSRIWKSQVKRQMYHALFLVECVDPTPESTHEATEVGFFGNKNLPPLAPGHHLKKAPLFSESTGIERQDFRTKDTSCLVLWNTRFPNQNSFERTSGLNKRNRVVEE